MGAHTFTIDPLLLAELRRLLPLQLFIETGTFKGDSIELARAHFPTCLSVDLSPELHAAAARRFAGVAGVELFLDDSPAFLARQRHRFASTPALFWLDAHWCVEGSAGDRSACPLLGELAAIGTLRTDSAILIDDARLFLSPPPLPYEFSGWPDLDAVIDGLRRLSAAHVVVAFNDVLMFVPRRIWPELREFCHRHVADVLSIHDRARAHDNILNQARAKEDLIATFGREWESLDRQLQEKHAAMSTVQAQATALAAQVQEKEALIQRLHQEAQSLAAQLQASHGARETERVAFEADRQRTEQALLAKEGAIQTLDRALDECKGHLQRLAGEASVPARVLLEARRSRSRLSALATRMEHRLHASLEGQLPYRLGTFSQYTPRLLQTEQFPRLAPRGGWPRICLITPSYQQAAYLERTMRSVLDQDYPNLAYGVQDGASTDGSAEIIVRHLPRLAHAASEKDQGQADAIVRGFRKLYPEAARGDLMAWLNSDDLLMPGALAYVGAYFSRHPEVDVVYGHRVVVDRDGRETGRWYLPRHHANTLPWFDLVPQETMFWRASAYERIEGIDPSFQFALDWDLLLRFEAAGMVIRRLPYFLGCFRHHAEQKTSARIQTIGEQEMAQLRRRTHGREVKRWEILDQLQREERRSLRTAWLHQRGLRW